MITIRQTTKPEKIVWCGADEPGVWTLENYEVEEEEVQEEGGLTQDDLIDVLSLYLF
ncbi:hypothetical protein [uncultured Chitinophaga sp.]|jgi:hypothetical protein|uniref:hypothetical protein n=1 Tax=uncultured Chitinophaga sp. TaxID=339340 RepID=UPI00260BA70A|nr:hypothetical protein [uncultured Chitinophaga sp.]